MANERNFRRRQDPNDRVSRNSYIASCVDAALAPLKRYLNGWQTQLVRSIVQANIEADPVSRRLVANAIRMRFRSHRRAPRTKDSQAGTKKLRRL